MRTSARALSYVGSPVMVKVACSEPPSAGMPGGLVSVAVGWVGAIGSRP